MEAAETKLSAGDTGVFILRPMAVLKQNTRLKSGKCWRLSMKKSGPWFNIKMLSYQYRKSHCGDKTVVRSSYLHNRISYTGKMTSLYWNAPLVSNDVYLPKMMIGIYECITLFIPGIKSYCNSPRLHLWIQPFNHGSFRNILLIGGWLKQETTHGQHMGGSYASGQEWP